MSTVVFITGASSGMGKETALQLLSEGYTVYGAARSVEKMKDLQEAGGHVLQMDVTDDSQMQDAVSEILSKEGRIDVLINNAGFGLYGAVEDTSLDDARYQFEVNLFGLARLTQLVLPHMREQRSGTIINISSMGGKIYTPFGAWYHATKHALEGWSDCLRLELQRFGINVVIIEPGIIDTNFYDVMLTPLLKRSGDGAYRGLVQQMKAMSERRRAGKNLGSPPSVIARVISRAISSKRPKTRYVAGQWARLLMFIRKYCGDRMYDRFVMGMVK